MPITFLIISPNNGSSSNGINVTLPPVSFSVYSEFSNFLVSNNKSNSTSLSRLTHHLTSSIWKSNDKTELTSPIILNSYHDNMNPMSKNETILRRDENL